MRNAYIRALSNLAEADDRILALVADNGAIVFDDFRSRYPGRFFNFGISEANMVSVAAGLAACGKVPFAYTISNFLSMRAFEQIRNGVCLQQMNVKLVGIGVGFVYSNLGPTHHAVEDVALMRALPGMTIFSPADPIESAAATAKAAEIDGPVYLRLATGGTPALFDDDYEFALGKAVTLLGGTDITVISTGNIVGDVLQTCKALKDKGLGVRLLHCPTLKPIDREAILSASAETKGIVVVEEHTIEGGLGSIVSEVVAGHAGPRVPIKLVGLNNSFPVGYGTYQEMKEQNGLGQERISSEILSLWEAHNG
ncbi:MAG: transketolase [Deltaproteobacteria bacterium]|nr:transketolase [Deltaproteobacteria bacterium]